MARKKIVEPVVEQVKQEKEAVAEAVVDTRVTVEVADYYKNFADMIVEGRLTPIVDGKVTIWATQKDALLEGGFVK